MRYLMFSVLVFGLLSLTAGLARAEYSFKEDVTFGFAPSGLVSGTDPSDSANTDETYSSSGCFISCCSSYNRCQHVALPADPALLGPISTNEVFCTISWEYIGGGPPGGVLQTTTSASVVLFSGTSVSERIDGKPTKNYKALAIARDPDLSFSSDGHTGFWSDGDTKTTNVNLMDVNHDDVYVRTTCTVGADPLDLWAFAMVSWAMSENIAIGPNPLPLPLGP